MDVGDGWGFEEFVASRGTALLRTAVFLAGDRAAGEDLLHGVLERCYRRWRRIDEPDRYVRRALANAAAERWRGRRREVPLGPDADRPCADAQEPVAARRRPFPIRVFAASMPSTWQPRSPWRRR